MSDGLKINQMNQKSRRLSGQPQHKPQINEPTQLNRNGINIEDLQAQASTATGMKRLCYIAELIKIYI